uniref:RNA polymerase I-specific transcription initiation factor RRN3 n=1 Tax=Picocystis salinarum TaxID=88271 RepID=A0A7S3UDS4_9CHLO
MVEPSNGKEKPWEREQQGLCKLLDAMADAVEHVDEEKHVELFHALARLSCWNVPTKVAQAHLNLIVELAACQAQQVPFVLQVLVRNFVPPLDGTWKDNSSQEDVETSVGEAWVPQPHGFRVLELVLNKVHEIVEMDPSSLGILLPMLNDQFPHPEQNRDAHCYYLCGVMQLAESNAGKPIRASILAAILENILHIEFHMNWQVFEMEEDEWDIEDAHMQVPDGPDRSEDEPIDETGNRTFLDGRGTDEINDTSKKDTRDTFHDQKRLALATADKLDSAMELLFAHLLRQLHAGHLEELLQVITQFMKHTVLPTRCSRIVHYVVFLLGCHSPARTCECFHNLLLKGMLSEDSPRETHLSCACYLASYLARAAFLPVLQLVGVLGSLCNWCVAYLDELEKKGSNFPELKMSNHLVFYSCCHCILYSLCFKMKDVLNDREGAKMVAVPVQRILNSKLDPLQVCLQTVVDEFVSQAARLGVSHLLPSTLDIQEPVQRHVESALNFFPYDHYVLGRSAAFLQLENTCTQWGRS